MYGYFANTTYATFFFFFHFTFLRHAPLTRRILGSWTIDLLLPVRVLLDWVNIASTRSQMQALSPKYAVKLFVSTLHILRIFAMEFSCDAGKD